jgi:TetR/AcrR family transcriptional repressor of nem operon
MDKPATTSRPMAPARRKLLGAALALIREKGYASTTLDDLCAKAGVAKGSFFHHFKDKEAIAVAAAGYWSEMTGALFEAAPYHAHEDPLDRVLGYIDFRKSIFKGELAEFTCLVGTMVQEIYTSNPAIRDACDASISGHAAKVEADIAEAMEIYGIHANWTAASLALHTQSVLQGAFILAKAKGGAEIAATSIDHLRRYIALLFQPGLPATKGNSHEHRQYISRGVSRQQDQPAHDGMERPPRGGKACKATRGDCGLEGMGRKTPCRDRRNGRTVGEDQKGNGGRC